jgi:hypothetical protein
MIAASSDLSSPEEGGRVGVARRWLHKSKGETKSKIMVRSISIELCEYKSDFNPVLVNYFAFTNT